MVLITDRYLTCRYLEKLWKIDYSRVMSLIDQEETLTFPRGNKQFGFRKNFLSTVLAIQDLLDKISKAIDDHKITVGIFLDL